MLFLINITYCNIHTALKQHLRKLTSLKILSVGWNTLVSFYTGTKTAQRQKEPDSHCQSCH